MQKPETPSWRWGSTFFFASPQPRRLFYREEASAAATAAFRADAVSAPRVALSNDVKWVLRKISASLASEPRSCFVLHLCASIFGSGGLVLEDKEGEEDLIPAADISVRFNVENGPALLILSTHGFNGEGEAVREVAQAFLRAGVRNVIVLYRFEESVVREIYSRLWKVECVKSLVAQVLETKPASQPFVSFFSQRNTLMLDCVPNTESLEAGEETQSQELVPVIEYFYGRENNCREFCHHLRKRAGTVIAVGGRPGTGKRSLVRECLRFCQERSHVSKIFWMDLKSYEQSLAEENRREKAMLKWTIDIAAGVLLMFSQSAKSLQEEISFENVAIKFRNALLSLRPFSVEEVKMVVVFENCEATVLLNPYFLKLIGQVLPSVMFSFIFIGEFTTPFTGLVHGDQLLRLKLEGMRPEKAQKLLRKHFEFGFPAQSQNIQALQLFFEKRELCFPGILKKTHGASREKIAADAQKEALSRYLRILALEVGEEEAAKGIAFWRRACEEDQGGEVKNASKCRKDTFIKMMQNAFAEADIPGESSRHLSTRSAQAILRLRARSPLRNEAIVTMQRFISPFWRWFRGTMKITAKLGNSSPHGHPLWQRRVRGPQSIPIVWFASREEATKRLSGSPIGTFAIRFSETHSGSLTIELVHESNNLRSLHVQVNPDNGAVTSLQGGPVRASLGAFVLSRRELIAVFAGPEHKPIPKEDVFMT